MKTPEKFFPNQGLSSPFNLNKAYSTRLEFFTIAHSWGFNPKKFDSWYPYLQGNNFILQQV